MSKEGDSTHSYSADTYEMDLFQIHTTSCLIQLPPYSTINSIFPCDIIITGSDGVKRLAVLSVLPVTLTLIFYLLFNHVLHPELLKRPGGVGEYCQVSMPFFYKVLRIDGADLVIRKKGELTLKLTSPAVRIFYARPGLFDHQNVLSFTVALHSPDEDNDGYPDVAELYGRDCSVFRDWMVYIAMSQKATPSDNWFHRDCSGLIRYSVIEALKVHDGSWSRETGLRAGNEGDVSAFNYPDIPVLGSRFFNTMDGFQGFADARNLLLHTCELIGRDRTAAKKGDLFFFYHPQDHVFPYHSVIYTEEGVVYHTGPTDDSDGFMRLWKMEDYLNAAPLVWQPVKENPNFLGFYRFRFLND